MPCEPVIFPAELGALPWQEPHPLWYPQDFPGGPLAKNPPFNAGDLGSIPGQGTKIPRAMGQLSLCAVTT